MLSDQDLMKIKQLIDSSFEANFDSRFEAGFSKHFQIEFDKHFDVAFNKHFETAFNKHFDTAFEKYFDAAFTKSIMKFWDEVLEPALSRKPGKEDLEDLVTTGHFDDEMAKIRHDYNKKIEKIEHRLK